MKRNKGKRAWLWVLLAVIAAAGVCFALFGGSIINRIRTAMYPIKYTDEICAAADGCGLDRALVFAVVSTESGFDPAALSRDGAEGLMQVLPSTAEWIDFRRGTALNEGGLFDPETNLDYGCWLLKYLLDRYGGSVRNALIAYNAGFGRADEWLNDPALVDESGEIADIPFAETRNYVYKVLDYKEIYSDIYADILQK